MIMSRTGKQIRRRTSLALSLVIGYLVLSLCVPITAFAEGEENGGAPASSAAESSSTPSGGAAESSSTPSGSAAGSSSTPSGSAAESSTLSAGGSTTGSENPGSSTPSAGITEISAPDLGVGADDVNISTPLTPPEGSAAIVEVVESGKEGNQVNSSAYFEGKDTEFTNDRPSVTLTETYNNCAGTDTQIPPGKKPDETAAIITDTMQPITVPEEGLVPEESKSTVVRNGETLIKTTVTKSDNAIQKAVSEALSKIQENTASVTIRVASGEYNGDISIGNSATSTYNVPENFILYVLADDSYSEPETRNDVIDKSTVNNSNSKGNAIINGNILIAHINVIMTGLYLSQGKTITVDDAKVTYNGTVKDDTVAVDIANSDAAKASQVTVSTGAGGDLVSLTNSGKETTEKGTVTVNTGSGDDVLQVHTDIAKSTGTVEYHGGEGNDRLHLTGDLKKDAEHTVSKDSLKLVTDSGKQLQINPTQVEDFTDNLSGKATTEINETDLTTEDEGKTYQYKAKEAFHNYILKGIDLATKQLTITGVDGQELFMSNLKVVADHITIKYLNASSMNVLLQGKKIIVLENGRLHGKNITMTAADSDSNLTPMINAITESVGLDVDVALGLADMVTETEIRINPKAVVEANGSVILSATNTQNQALLVVGAISPLGVKVGSSHIVLDGMINATGSVSAEAINTFRQDASNSALSAAFVPLAVMVLVSDTEVNVGRTGTIRANGAVSLKAATNIQTTCMSYTGKLPITLAVTVVVGDTSVLVDGYVTSYNGDITLDASTKANIQTGAYEKAPMTQGEGSTVSASSVTFGGFFAVAVVLENVKAALRGAGSLMAPKGNVSILSNSEQVVITKADASLDPAAAPKSQTMGQVLSIVSNLVGTVKKFLLGESGPVGKIKNKLAAHFSKVDDNISGGSYNITVEPTTNGTVTAPQKGKGDGTTLIKVNPNPGYTIGTLTITYTDPDTKAPITRDILPKNLKTTDVTFQMPKTDATIVAIFRKLNSGEAALKEGTGTVSNSPLNDKLDAAAANSSSFVEPEYGTTYNVGEATYLGTGSGYIATNTKTADAGQEVLVRVTPGANHTLKRLNLIASLDGRKVTTQIKANSEGDYIFTMPAGDVKFEAEFVPGASTGGGSGSSSGSVGGRLVGAVAVAVVDNDNEAYSDTTGSITALGTVTIDATALTQSTTLADASAVKQTQAMDPNIPPVQAADGLDTDKTVSASTQQLGAESNQVKLVISNMVNGEVKLESSAANIKLGQENALTFKVTPRVGYLLSTNGLKVSYLDANGKSQNVAVTPGTDNTYQATLPISQNMLITVEAGFEADRHRITGSITNPSYQQERLVVAEKANAGDTVTIATKPMEGQKAVIAFDDSTITVTPIGDNKFTFVMPAAAVSFKVTFQDKDITVTYDNNLTASNAAPVAGETVVLTMTQSAMASGKKLNVTAKYGTKTITVTENNDGTFSFQVPADCVGEIVVSAAQAGEITGAYAVVVEPDLHGSVATKQKVNLGETLSFVVTPNSGYMLKENSLKIHITSGSTELVEIISKDTASGKYSYKLAESYGDAVTGIKITADFVGDKMGLSAPGIKTFSAGVGVDVTVTNHSNTAYIKNTNVQSGGLVVNAASGSDSSKLISSATSKAGYSQGSFGVAGAITVHVLTAKTQAYLEAGATKITLTGGDLKVTASSVEDILTAAEGSGTSGTTSIAVMGVGAGIALAITGVDVIARVDDNLNLTRKTEAAKLNTVAVTASHSGTEALNAKAGSAGGISVTPVLGLIVGGVLTEATLGKLPDTLDVQGDLEISAQNTMFREMTANAAAAGGQVGMGGSFALSVLNDSAKASLRNSAKARNVKVRAVSRSTMKSTSRAGANGAASTSASTTPSTSGNSGSGSSGSEGSGSGDSPSQGKGDSTTSEQKSEADKQADRAIGNGIGMAGSTGSGNLSQEALNTMVAGRQMAQTAEGSIQVAAAFVLNVHKNASKATIEDGVTIQTPDSGKVAVNTENNTISAIYANASATNSRIGVGVAVAINVVTYDNLAIVGDAAITTGNLEVTALMYKELVKQVVTRQNTQDNTIIEKLLRQTFTELFDELTEELDLKGTLGGLWDAFHESFFGANGAVAKLIGDAVNTLLSGTGLEGLISTDIKQRIENRLANLGTTATEAVKTQVINAVLNMVLSKVQAMFADKPMEDNPYTNTLTPGSQLSMMATNIANEVFADIIDVTAMKNFFKGNMAETMKENAVNTLKGVGKALSTATLDTISAWLELKAKPSETTPTHTFITHAIAGAGASHVGVAGSVAIAVVNGTTKALIESTTANRAIQVSGDMAIHSASVQKLDTVASAAVGPKGAADRNLAASGTSDQSGGGNATQYPSHSANADGSLMIGGTNHGQITSFTRGENSFTVSVTPDPKYKVQSITLTRSDNGKTTTINVGDGTGTAFQLTGEQYTTFVKDLPENAVITAVALFEDTRTVHDITTEVSNAAGGTVPVVSHLGEKTPATQAHAGEQLFVTVNPKDGYTLDSLYYCIGSGKTVQITSKENPTGNIFTFYLPDQIKEGEKITVTAAFRQLNPGEKQLVNASPVTTATGSSVGVGAAFAMNYGDMISQAGIGENRVVNAGTLDISAEGTNDITTISVAGTDPISGTDNTGASGETEQTGNTSKTYSLDASVALNLCENTVGGFVGSGTVVTTTSNDLDVGTFDEEKFAPAEDSEKTEEQQLAEAKAAAQDLLSLRIQAIQTGATMTKASAFATGAKAAVGAAVAINIVDSDVSVDMAGNLFVNGLARFTAQTFNEDDSFGLATAMGADMERILSKFRTGTDKVEENTNKVTQGTWTEEDLKSNNNQNQTAGKVNGKLTENANNSGTGGEGAQTSTSNTLPTSTNALRSQNAGTGTTPDTTKSQDAVNKADPTGNGSDTTVNPTMPRAQSIQVAAAVALNITNHEAVNTISGNVTAGTVSILADNNGNFRTRGSGATMTMGSALAAIAAAVAVSVNNNRAVSNVSGSIVTDADHVGNTGNTINAEDAGNVTIEAQLTQNMDNEYRGALGAQAVAGSVTGVGSKATISGAIAVLVSKAATEATFNKEGLQGKSIAAAKNITLSATDKSKLAVRAGAVSISSGSAIGVGASIATIYGQNNVISTIGGNSTIEGKSLTVEAKKLRVDMSDFGLAHGITTLISDSSVSNGSPTSSAGNKGILDLNKDSASSSYSVSINITSENILDAIDLMNFLASTNYYVEAIAGSVISPASASSQASVAGSIAVAYFTNLVKAMIGDNCKIDMSGDVAVNAETDTNARLIGGALSVSPAKAGVGLNAAAIANNDRTYAFVGKLKSLDADGSYHQIAKSNTDFMNLTAAASVGTNPSGNTIGGVLNVIVMDNETKADLGEGTKINAGKDINVKAIGNSWLLHVTAAVAGTTGSVAAGVGLTTIVVDSDTIVNIGNRAKLISDQASVEVSAEYIEKLIAVLISAGISTSGTAAAAVANVLVSDANTKALVGENVTLQGYKNVSVLAKGDSWILSIALAAAGASQNAGSATISVEVVTRDVLAQVGKGSTLDAQTGAVLVQALGEDWMLSLILTAGAGGTNALSGMLPVTVGESKIRAIVADGTADQYTTLNGGDAVGVIANLDSHNYIVAGSVSASGSNAIGATVDTAVFQNTIEAHVGNYAKVTTRNSAFGEGIRVPNRDKRRRGVTVSATAMEDIITVAVSGAFSGSGAVTGVVNTLVVANTVKATVGNNVTMTAVGSDATASETVDGASGDVSVEADDDSFLLNLAGALSASGSFGVGATVVTLVFTKEVEASVGTSGSIAADGTVSVIAGLNGSNKDKVMLLAIAFGISGSAGVAGDVSTLVFVNKTTAALGGNVQADGDLNVKAAADSELYNIAAAASASGSAAVSAVAIVTYFRNETYAFLRSGTNAGTFDDHIGGNVSILANSRETVDADAAGISGSGVASVGGTLDVIVTQVKTKAYTDSNVNIYADGDLKVEAEDDYTLRAIATSIAGSGTAAVGVTALVSVSFNTINAGLGSGSVNVNNAEILAKSVRDVLSVSATIAGSGVAGVGATLTAIVAGNRLSQDAHDTLYSGSEDGTMNPQAQVNGAFNSSHSAARQYQPTDSLDTLLAGDGQKLGTEDYGNYGQTDENSDPDTAPVKGDGKLYILVDGKYVPITDEEAAGKYKDTQRYLYDSEKDEYVETNLTSANTFDSTQYEQTAENNKLTAKPIIGLSDTTFACVSSGATVTAAADIKVQASDTLNTNIISGTVAIGGAAGVGVGLTVAILNSNVQALVDDDATLDAGENIVILASAGAAVKTAEQIAKIESFGSSGKTYDELEKQNISTTGKNTMRLISVTIGGIAGVGVSGAVMTVFSTAKAILEGNVKNAKTLKVESKMNYGDVLVVNTGLAAGLAGVNVSLAATYFQGEAEASIIGDANITDTNLTKLDVITTGKTNSTVAVGGLAAGAVGVNAGVGLAVNRTTVRSYIDQNVVVDAAKAALTVKHDFEANANAFMISIAGGAVAVGTSVAVVVNKLDAESYVGHSSDSDITDVTGSITVKSIDVSAKAKGDTSVNGAGIAAGGIAVNGSVSLGLGFIRNIAAIRGIHITTGDNTSTDSTNGDITVTAAIDGDVVVFSTSLVGGAVAVGATVDVAYIGSTNKAILDLTGSAFSAAGDVSVNAGTETKPNDSYCQTIAITGTAGVAAYAVNLALSFNKAVNNAEILGTSGTLGAKSIEALAYGGAKAHTLVVNAAFALGAASASLAFAWVGSQQKANMDTNAVLTVEDGLTVRSVLSTASPETLTAQQKGKKDGKEVTKDLSVAFKNAAEARIYSASVGMTTVTANGAVALSDATSSAVAGFAGSAGAVTVSNSADSKAYAQIDNLDISIKSVGVMIGFTFASGTFEAIMKANGDIACDSVTITNTYNSVADTEVTPAAGGVKVSSQNIGLNTAAAYTTTRANTGISGSSTITSARNVSVTAKGYALAKANIVTPTASFSGIDVTANIAVAVNRVRQNTFIRDCALNTTNGNVTLISNLNKGINTLDDNCDNSGAIARVGASSGTGIKISVVGGNANVCVANFDAVNEALASSISGVIKGNFGITARTYSFADAGVYSANNISYFSGTVTTVHAYAGGTSRADLITTRGKKITTRKLSLTNRYQTLAKAESKQSANGISVNFGGSVTVNTAIANARSNACAGIEGDGEVEADPGKPNSEGGETPVSIDILCEGTAQSDAKVLSAALSYDNIKIAANNVVSTVSATHAAHIGSQSQSPAVTGNNGDIRVISRFNEAPNCGATAKVGSGGGTDGSLSITMIGGEESSANANMEAQAKAGILNGAIHSSNNVIVEMHGTLFAKADVDTGSEIGMYNATVLVARANAKGSMDAYMNADEIDAASVTLSNEYKAESDAQTGAAGALKAGLISAGGNVAYATTESSGTTVFGAARGGNIRGSVTVSNLGRVSAKALGKTAKVTISGVNIAVNVIDADLRAKQDTQFNYGGELTIGGGVNINSEFVREGIYGKADAQTGAASGTDLSIVGGTVNSAKASSATENELTVTGDGISVMTVVGDFTARAKSVTEGNITLTKLRTMNTTTGFTAGADMRFDDWMSEKSKNTVVAGSTFGMRETGGTSFEDYEKGYGNRAFIKYAPGDTDANALLSVSAGNVGKADNRLVVDISEELTMKMPDVGNAYIDALELILADSASFDSETGKYDKTWLSGENNLLTGYFVTTADNPKINEFPARDPATGKESLQGDKLNHITDKNVQTEFEIPESEVLADRFVNGANTLSGVLDQNVVVGMLGNELSGKVLAEIISDEKREELLDSLGMLEGLTDVQKENLLAPDKAESVISSILKNTDNADAVYNVMMGTDVNGQKKLFTLLLDTQLSGQIEGSPFVNLDQLVHDLLTAEEREALYQQAIRENGIPAEADTVPTGDLNPRAFNVEIGVSTGSTTIYNDGDINITVTADSDLTAEDIKSERGDVSIDVLDGSILSAGSGANITGENVKLDASENIGIQGNPVNVDQVEEEPGVTVTLTGDNGVYRKTVTDAEGNETTIWVMDVDLSYDWARLDDTAATKRLDAVAKGGNGTDGSIFLAEQTGNTGLGTLNGAGMVSIQTPGNVTNVRTDAEKAAGTPNITAEDATVISDDGQIGTQDAPVAVRIDNHMTASAERDVNVSTAENLSITADSQVGELNIAGEKNLTVDNTAGSAGGTGDMSIGSIVADGNVSINAAGDMLPTDSDSLVSGDHIELEAGGIIGSDQQPLRLDTAAGDTGSGSLTAVGGMAVTVEEINGDLAIDSVVSGGNANIIADGSITDTNGSAVADAADAQKKADDARNLADAAQSEADVLDEYAAGFEKIAADKEKLAKEAAERAAEIQEKIDDALAKNPNANVNALLNQLKLAQAAADKAQAIADQAKAEADAQRAIADQAATKAQQLTAAATASQNAADKALDKANGSEPSIKTGGDLNLTADGPIGTDGNALDTQVGGKTNISAAGDVNLSEEGDMHIGTITNPEDAKLALNSTGGIASDSVITGDSLDINALGGNMEVELDVNRISGTASGDAQINNAGDLLVDDLTVDGTLKLSVEGSIEAGTKLEGTANITAGVLTLTVPGSQHIGSHDDPLTVGADSISAEGAGIYLDLLKDVTINHIKGQKVELDVNGDVLAGKGRPEHIWADSLDMVVQGNIGEPKNPLLIHVPGGINISTVYGLIYVQNLYRPVADGEEAKPESVFGFGRIVSDADFRFVPYAFMSLRPVELCGDTLSLKEAGGSRMVAIRGNGLETVEGNVLYIWALAEDGVSVTYELRHLHLTTGTVRMMRALGYEWLMFRTGDSVVVIHLTELENGTYLITVDPQNADGTVSVTLDGEEQNGLPDSMYIAEITDAAEKV